VVAASLYELMPTEKYGRNRAATPGETSGDSPNLVAVTQNDYDLQNRVYESLTYSVDPATGNVSSAALTTYTFYGPDNRDSHLLK
jgi:hypothetical protein